MVSISERQTYQPNAMHGSNLDPDLNKSTIKDILETRKMDRKSDNIKELILLDVIYTLFMLKSKMFLDTY